MKTEPFAPQDYGHVGAWPTLRDTLVLTFSVRTLHGNDVVEYAKHWAGAVHQAVRLAHERSEPMVACDDYTGHLLVVEHISPAPEDGNHDA